MKRVILDSLPLCNEFLKANKCFANGKNFPVTHLYATAAQSRWCYENLWGIYLTKPQYTWMALWMAATSRSHLKKRQIQYHRPQREVGDYVGHITIYSPDVNPVDFLCDQAYVYLFDLQAFENLSLLDISSIRQSSNPEHFLNSHGFARRIVERRSRIYDAWLHNSQEPLLVDVDEWQVACINREQIAPSTEIVLTKNLISQLESRVKLFSGEVGENYIV
jgi:hypothetical protein